jgi:type II secretory pathway component PulF
MASRDFVVGVVQAALGLAMGAITVSVAQKFTKIFQDFGAELPGMTIFLIGFAHFLGHYWYLAVLVIVSWPLVNWRIVSVLSPRPDVVIPRRLWYVVTWGVLGLAVPFVVVALLVPLTGLISKLSK